MSRIQPGTPAVSDVLVASLGCWGSKYRVMWLWAANICDHQLGWLRNCKIISCEICTNQLMTLMTRCFFLHQLQLSTGQPPEVTTYSCWIKRAGDAKMQPVFSQLHAQYAQDSKVAAIVWWWWFWRVFQIFISYSYPPPPKFKIATCKKWLLEDQTFLLGFGNFSGVFVVKLGEAGRVDFRGFFKKGCRFVWIDKSNPGQGANGSHHWVRHARNGCGGYEAELLAAYCKKRFLCQVYIAVSVWTCFKRFWILPHLICFWKHMRVWLCVPMLRCHIFDFGGGFRSSQSITIPI